MKRDTNEEQEKKGVETKNFRVDKTEAKNFSIHW